jgi:hypothetical protein
MSSDNFGRRGLLKKGAAIGLAASAAGMAVAAGAQDATPAATDIDKVKSDVRTEFDKAKSELDRLGGDVGDDSKDAFDELKKGFDAIGDELAKAEAIPHDSVKEIKRAYRAIQHKLDDFDRGIERLLDKGDTGVKDVFHDIRKAAHEVHKRIDHVFDEL